MREAREIAVECNIHAIPCIKFFFNSKEHSQVEGAKEPEFRSKLSDLHELTRSRAGDHSWSTFKQFKPSNTKPVGFTQAAQLDKMKEFLTKLVSQSTERVNSLQQWLRSFNVESMDKEAIDQLMSLAQSAEDKQRIALADLMRLLVLSEAHAEYIFGVHWDFIDNSVFDYIF